VNRLRGKLIVITGATSGIGKACAEALAAMGANLVLAARREERLIALSEELRGQHGITVHARVLDVRDRQGVSAFAASLDSTGLEVHGLVNNAGLARGLSDIQNGDHADWDEMIDTNIKGLLNVTRAILPGMVARDQGHVVNIGSVAGHWVYPMGNVYNATKFAVRALTEALNMDLVGTAIRVSGVDPGMVRTEFSLVRFHGDNAQAEQVYKGLAPLGPEDVADAVCYVMNAPPHVNVLDMVIYPTAQRSPFVVSRSTEGTEELTDQRTDQRIDQGEHRGS